MRALLLSVGLEVGLFCCYQGCFPVIRALLRDPQLRQFEILEADPADAVVLELCSDYITLH